MVRYYGFLSPSKRAVLDVVYLLTETARKTAWKVTWRGMYQRLLKVDPVSCILCGRVMCFSGLKRGLRLPELLACHEQLAQMKICGQARMQGRSVRKA